MLCRITASALWLREAPKNVLFNFRVFIFAFFRLKHMVVKNTVCAFRVCTYRAKRIRGSEVTNDITSKIAKII
jgi:hypothetical protein